LLHYSWDCLTATTAQMLKQTCISYNEVCNFYYSLRSWKYWDFFVKTKTKIKTFSSRPRPRPRLLFQDQDQYHFSCPRGASTPRPRSRDYISAVYAIIQPRSPWSTVVTITLLPSPRLRGGATRWSSDLRSTGRECSVWQMTRWTKHSHASRNASIPYISLWASCCSESIASRTPKRFAE